MNKEWSELHKIAQAGLRKKDFFDSSINMLLILRKQLMEQIDEFKKELSNDDFCAMPYINVKGYHSKTVAYSLWHIFRIEDIVAHSLVSGNEQVFFKNNYQKRINSPIITTGNELVRKQIGEFSKQLCIDELYYYVKDVIAVR